MSDFLQVLPQQKDRYRRDMQALAVQYFSQRERLSPAETIELIRVMGAPTVKELCGPFSWAQTPYLRPIFERFWSRGFSEGAVAKASQLGFTDGVLINIVAYAAYARPGSISFLLPSDVFAQDFSKDKIDPLLEHSPIVAAAFASAKARDADATILNKKMRSGYRLRLFGANSVKRLKSFAGIYRLLDETDDFENDPKQGDPEDLLDRSALTGSDHAVRKLKGTTPTLDYGRGWKDYLAGDQQKLHITCPSCSMPFVLTWNLIRWDKTTEHHPETAHAVCPNGHKIPHELKRQLVTAGRYIPTNPKATMPSWHIPGFVSFADQMSWPKTVTKFLEAGKDPAKLKVVFNTRFGEPFEDRSGERIHVESLRDRRDKYAAEVPAGVGVLTLAVDVQRLWMEVLLVGWGAGEESWRIHHWRLEGDTSVTVAAPGQVTVWDRLSQLIQRAYVHEAGIALTPAITLIDSADGERTQVVYDFVKAMSPWNVFAARGEKMFNGRLRANREAMVRIGTASDTSIRLVRMNTYAARNTVYSRLRIKSPGYGRMHWPLLPEDSPEFPEDYFKQFENEKKVSEPIAKGSSVMEDVWVTTGRNEGPDLEVISLCALHQLGDAVRHNLVQLVTQVAAQGEALRLSRELGTPKFPVRTERPETPGRDRPLRG